jgi:hypothetical protein
MATVAVSPDLTASSNLIVVTRVNSLFSTPGLLTNKMSICIFVWKAVKKVRLLTGTFFSNFSFSFANCARVNNLSRIAPPCSSGTEAIMMVA